MAEGAKAVPADRATDQGPSWWLAGLEQELTSIVERMEAEIADQRMVTEKSVSDLHDLRVAAERLVRANERAD